ncbi:TOTE conflict system archaeo-eukaryotic primase domain-containing protein [Maribellus mangrovi]|uniref:TOTE conflict system archaeo-eukaryotic primase domain-containing protein n=1 Tax=Maribellus mangrovi TaxID=3133146 RepID=UPI0030EEADE6
MSVERQYIELFKTHFRGRNDLYAVRWEKDGKSGYMPAYKVDWSNYQKHKAQGGTFKDFKDKEYLPFDDLAIENHLSGKETCGIYPLLEDNTSFFIAVDFDKANWKEIILRLHKTCSDLNLPSYIEKSRSGNGGHLWIFFEEAFPAEQSRKIMFEMLRNAGIISHFEKEPSFDRLFPNQDFHSGKGIGNLIALPINGTSIKHENSCFLDPNSFEPYKNQWDFLSRVKKATKVRLKDLYKELFNMAPADILGSFNIDSIPELEIIIQNQIYLKRVQLNRKLIHFLREQLNFYNSDYLAKKNLGKSTFNTEKFFNLIEESEIEVMIPRGFTASLIHFCKTENIPFKIIDKRIKKESIEFKSDISLQPYQKMVLDKVRDKDFGVIVSPPGTGKTVVGLEIIANKKQPALILVHRKQLFDQWIERIQSFLKIPKKEIGQIGNQKNKIGKQITVAMIQSLARREDYEDISNEFGTIIIDECHHIPAKSFREAIVKFNAYYLYGLTATPQRKNNDQKLIFVFIGNIIHRLDQHEYLKQKNIQTEINITETGLYAPFDYKIDNYETISNILIHDTNRNSLILGDIETNAERFKSILILSERKAHVELLHLYLKDKFETITIHGDDPAGSRKSKIEQIKQGHYKIVISTGQYFGEGIDINNLECLFIAYPFAFKGKLIQYIGRIQRSEKPPVIFDYRDSKIDYFEKMFK